MVGAWWWWNLVYSMMERVHFESCVCTSPFGSFLLTVVLPIRFHIRFHIQFHIRFHIRFHTRCHIRCHIRCQYDSILTVFYFQCLQEETVTAMVPVVRKLGRERKKVEAGTLYMDTIVLHGESSCRCRVIVVSRGTDRLRILFFLF